MSMRCELRSIEAGGNLNFIPTERAVFETSLLPPDEPFLKIIEDTVDQQATKKIKPAPLRSMKKWNDEEMTILLRIVKANHGHMKTGILHYILFVPKLTVYCRYLNEKYMDEDMQFSLQR